MPYEGVSARPTTISLAEVRESVSGQPMSAAGHSRRFDRVQLTSGPTPQADIIADRRHVSKVPLAEVVAAYSIKSLVWRDRTVRHSGSPALRRPSIYI